MDILGSISDHPHHGQIICKSVYDISVMGWTAVMHREQRKGCTTSPCEAAVHTVYTNVGATCEVVKAVMLQHLVQDAKKLPHLRGDGLTSEAERQRQNLLIELCKRMAKCCQIYM